MSKSEIGAVFGQSNNRKYLSTAFSFINQSATSRFIQYSQWISQIVTRRSKSTCMMLLNLSLYRCTHTIQSMVVNFFDWLIDWFNLSPPPRPGPQPTTYCCLLESLLITLSTARCLYQVQWIPSTLYESLYVLTLSSLLYRPCVATLVTAVISPRLICSHWLELLIFGHQAAMCLPSVKRLSLASAGACRLSVLLEAVNALSGMRMSSTPSGIEQLWTTNKDTKWSSNRIYCDLHTEAADFENNSTTWL